MAIEIFSLSAIPAFIYFLFLFSVDHKDVRKIYSVLLLTSCFVSIYIIKPVNYLFTFLIFYMTLIYFLDRIFKSLIPQIVINLSFLLFLAIKPGYVLVFFMHYQRSLLLISEILKGSA